MSYLFDSKQLKEVTGPGVYQFFKGDRVIYVGATGMGLGRCCLNNHPMAQYFSDPDVTLTFEPAATASEAFDLAAQMVLELLPLYNRDTVTERNRQYKAEYRAVRQEAKKHNTDIWKEKQLLYRFHLRPLQQEWPDAKVIQHQGQWIIRCGEKLDKTWYYNRKRDTYVFNPEDATVP